MKLRIFVGMALGAEARLQGVGQQLNPPRHAALLGAAAEQRIHYGDTRCPCIGFDNLKGETRLMVDIGKGYQVPVSYPADMGARCEAWDDGRYPGCRPGDTAGPHKDFCSQHWCFVDPCRCGIDVLPKLATFTPDATFQGKPLYWSYETCGGRDMFSKEVPDIGSPRCRCIGFAGVSGSTEITFSDGKSVEYPADFGSSCSAWDYDRHDDCKGDKVPSWCKANWCYVDPCECNLPNDVVPKISAYLPDATFTGKNLYYSYETCGSPDLWTEHNHPTACVNQETEKECDQQTRCAWTGERCLGRELVEHPLCSKDLGESKSEKSQAASPGVRSLLVGIAIMASAGAVVATVD